MAIIYNASLDPSKQQLLAAWLAKQPWGGSDEQAEVELLGSYRFDDPDGEVGVEAFVVRRGDLQLHVPLTYRAAPLTAGDGSEDRAHLVGTTEHSVLGTRWVYDGTADPVALGCYLRALRGQQQPADMEFWDGDRLIGHRPTSVQVTAAEGSPHPQEMRRVVGTSPTDPAAAADGAEDAVAVHGVEGTAPGEVDGVVEVEHDGATLRLVRRIGAAPGGGPALIAQWADERAVVAVLG